jgi:CIC family chloride channel protein
VKNAAFVRFLRFRIWLNERLRLGQLPITLFWAGLIGFVGAMASVMFRGAIIGLQWFFAHGSSDIVQSAVNLPWWEKLLITTIGGLAAGAVMHWGIKFTNGQSSTDYMEAVVVGNGVVPPRTTLVKVVSSLFTIASGGSIGREGPMVQLSAMLASLMGHGAKFPAPRLRLIVACGAAAGIASAYNAPIAGALFVSEIVLGTIAMETFGPLVFSSVVATLTVHQFLGTAPAYKIPAFPQVSPIDFIFYIILGILAGLIAPAFLKLLSTSENLFHKLKLPLVLKLALGGLIVGIISISYPEVWGNGYEEVSSILNSEWTWKLLLSVLVFKILATSTTVGSGAVGGVFTPTLFVGAALGCLTGHGMHALFPNLTNPSTAYTLVGMGCFLAATTHAPLMAIIMLFEMTLQYSVVLPLMVACVTAYYTARSVSPLSVYSQHLARRSDSETLSLLSVSRVGDLCKKNFVSVTRATTFGEIVRLFTQVRTHNLFVVDYQNRFLGAISVHELKPFLHDKNLARTILALDLMKTDFPVLEADQSLVEAMEVFANHEGERLPVVNELTERRLLGFVAKTDILLAMLHKKR